MCVSPCLCVCVCVFLLDNSRRNRSGNTKLEYVVLYENSASSDQGQGHCRRSKVFPIYHNTNCKFLYFNLARNLILSMYVHLILIYNIYECRHA